MKTLWLSALFLVTGCLHETTSDSKPSVSSTVNIYIESGARQCFPESGKSAQQTAQLLENLQIKVLESKCAAWSNRIYPTVCGGGTGKINIHLISDADLEKAQSLGFNPLTTDEYSITACR